MTSQDTLSAPYIDHTGTVVIPFNADPKYHFWAGGQHLAATLMELDASEDVWYRHIHLKPYPREKEAA